MNLIIIPRTRLDDDDELDLARLLAACEEADGTAELPLDKSLNHDQTLPSFFLAKDGDAVEAGLLGILSVFSPLAAEAEITSFVRPDLRGKGVFLRLLAAAEEALGQAGFQDELFVCESGQDAGAATVIRMGARKDFTEFSLSHPATPEARAILEAAVAGAPGLLVRQAAETDLFTILRVIAGSFYGSPEDEESIVRASLSSATRRQYLALAGDQAVGAAALGFNGEEASIHGVAISPESRSLGYGRALVARLALLAQAEGKRATIDVDSTNARAYHLYLSLGFTVDRATDYWRRPFPR